MDRFYRWLAWKLPRGLVMWCWYRVAAHATSGRWGAESPIDVKMMDAISRWDDQTTSNGRQQ